MSGTYLDSSLRKQNVASATKFIEKIREQAGIDISELFNTKELSQLPRWDIALSLIKGYDLLIKSQWWEGIIHTEEEWITQIEWLENVDGIGSKRNIIAEENAIRVMTSLNKAWVTFEDLT